MKKTADDRQSILSRLRDKIARNEPIVGGGAGTGISAKCEEAGGIDLMVIYNSGRYRMAGRGSLSGLLPYGNANRIVKELAYEVLTVVERTPVLAGVCGTDPFMIRDLFLRELKEMGFAGIQNFPTVGLFDGAFRADLEATGMGFGLEVDCVAAARELDLLTTPYAFNCEEAKLMVEAGADILVAHMGLTTGGVIGSRQKETVADCRDKLKAMVEIAKSTRSDAIVICHGGPISQPEDARYVFEHVPGIDGFYGASSLERLPTEVAITGQVKRFVELRLRTV